MSRLHTTHGIIEEHCLLHYTASSMELETTSCPAKSPSVQSIVLVQTQQGCEYLAVQIKFRELTLLSLEHVDMSKVFTHMNSESPIRLVLVI